MLFVMCANRNVKEKAVLSSSSKEKKNFSVKPLTNLQWKSFNSKVRVSAKLIMFHIKMR